MKQIDFRREKQIDTAEYTSRGNQPKWFRDGFWYKQDYMGYEAMAEVISSRLLELSSVDEYVEYSPILITADGFTRAGCMSNNILRDGESIIPINKLHRLYCGKSLAQAVSEEKSLEDRIKYTVDFVSRVTELSDFGRYLTSLLEFDAVIMNEDRHFNNIAVIYNMKEDKYRYCPIFDNGLSFLSDLKTYPLDSDSYLLMDKPQGKPFERDYEAQAQACRSIYGSSFSLHLKKADLDPCFDELSEYYREDIIARAQNVIYYQLMRCGAVK